MTDGGSPLDDDVLAALREPDAYPGDASARDGVETVQTHLSHLFLTRDRVYKFRRPVDLGFVCFTSRAERNADCLREVALNRRLAPDVYLGVAPLRVGAGGVRVGEPAETLAEDADGAPAETVARDADGAPAETVARDAGGAPAETVARDAGGAPAETVARDADGAPEHCVVMRRLPEGRDALSLLERGALTRDHLERVARRIAAFHAANGLGVPAPFDPDAWRSRCVDPVLESFDTIASTGVVASDRLERARRRCEAFVHEHGARFEARRAAGRAVDAHGDLHLQHVWLERDDAEPVMIDGLEFDARLREIDAAAEIGFTAMDLHYRGRADLASLLLRAYALESGDFDLYGVVDYFVAYRAAVRGKVAAIAAGDTGLGAAQRARAAESAERHVDLAVRALARRPPGAVVLVGGIVGTGKSTVARVLADALDAVPGVAVVSSDRVRKHLAGLGPFERTDAGLDEGLYAPERVARTYETLTAWARPVSESGRVVVLDATWSSRLERHRALTAATALGARWLFVETRCAEATTRERLRHRRGTGGDPSDAGEEMYAQSASRFEPLEGDEALHRRIVATDGADWRSEVAAIAEEIRGG